MADVVIRQLDVFENPSKQTKAPYIVIIQATLLDELETVVAAPLARHSPLNWPAALTPQFTFAGETLTLLTHQLGAIPRRRLGAAIGSLAAERDTILRAFDVLWSGH